MGPETPGLRLSRRAFGRLGGLGLTLLAVGWVGAAWLAWDVATTDEPSNAGDAFDRINAYIAHEMEGSRIPGLSLAVVENGTIVHAAGFGDDGRGNPVTPDTPFWIGSNTKSITALAIMQLAESGAVDLDAPVQDYVPDLTLRDPDAAAAMTVRHLLNQTSGISRIDGLRAVVDTDREQSIRDVVAGMADVELNRPLGQRFEYSNLNSVLLGAVIEAVTGQAWADHVQTSILDPLRMTSTYTEKTSAGAAGLTATHRYVFGFPIEADGEHIPGLAPTGYVYAGAADMARYLALYTNRGVLDGRRILSEAGIDAMLTPATDERTFALQSQPFTARYGAGWFVGPFGAADDARWHQGSLPHFTAWMVLLPDTDQAVVVMINAGNQFEIGGANAAWSRIPRGVVDILRGSDPPNGMGTARFFIVFDTLLAMAVIAQGWTFARVVGRSRARMRPTLRRAAPLLGELAVAPLALFAYPALTGGLGWRAAFLFLPDLSLSVLVLAGLAVATGVVRAGRLVTARSDPAR